MGDGDMEDGTLLGLSELRYMVISWQEAGWTPEFLWTKTKTSRNPRKGLLLGNPREKA